MALSSKQLIVLIMDRRIFKQLSLSIKETIRVSLLVFKLEELIMNLVESLLLNLLMYLIIMLDLQS